MLDLILKPRTDLMQTLQEDLGVDFSEKFTKNTTFISDRFPRYQPEDSSKPVDPSDFKKKISYRYYSPRYESLLESVPGEPKNEDVFMNYDKHSLFYKDLKQIEDKLVESLKEKENYI